MKTEPDMQLARFADQFGFTARQLRAALSLPGLFNQIRGKRPEAYIAIVNRHADKLQAGSEAKEIS